MNTVRNHDSIESFKTNDPIAWEALRKYFEEDESISWDNIQGLAQDIRSADDEFNDETVDSCYISQEYAFTTDDGKFRFSVTGSSYRKDQSVCEEEIDPTITVTDLEMQKEEKQQKKKEKVVESENQWKEFFKGKALEEILKDLQTNYKFPKKH